MKLGGLLLVVSFFVSFSDVTSDIYLRKDPPRNEFKTGPKTISLQNNKVTWKEALTSCQQQGKEFLTIDSLEDHYAVNSKLLEGGLVKDVIWIGASNRMKNEFEWEAVPDQMKPMRIKNWDAKEPGSRRNMCVAVNHYFSWVTKPCTEKLQYFCQDRTPPECEDDSKCSIDKYCKQNKCVERPTKERVCADACGANTNCDLVNNEASCTCKEGYTGNPSHGCRHECESDAECHGDKYCKRYKCVTQEDVCAKKCGSNAQCKVYGNEPLCGCNSGHIGNPYNRNTGCEKGIVVNAETCWGEDHYDHQSLTCMEYFHHRPDKQFYIFRENATWFEALEHCKNENKMLAIIENRHQQNVLENMLVSQNLIGEKLWIAGSDLKVKGLFQWISGLTFNKMQYTNWHENEPRKRSSGESSCVTMAERLSWATEDCSQGHYVICQSV